MGVKVREKVKGSGVWWVFINYRGKRESTQVGAEKSAYEVKRLLEAKLALGDYDFMNDTPISTFKEYADSWMKTTVPATCKPSTQEDYQAILDLHVLPLFKSKAINVIKRGHIKNFLLSKISEGFAGSTVTHMKNVVSGIMNKALDEEVVIVNPALGLGKIIQSTNHNDEINPLTAPELNQLLGAFEEHFSEYFTLSLLLARTGMRIGEAIALKWGDIDFNRRFIEIRRSFARGRVSTPRSGKCRRVDMSPQLKLALKKHQAESKRKGMKLCLGDAP